MISKSSISNSIPQLKEEKNAYSAPLREVGAGPQVCSDVQKAEGEEEPSVLRCLIKAATAKETTLTSACVKEVGRAARTALQFYKAVRVSAALSVASLQHCPPWCSHPSSSRGRVKGGFSVASLQHYPPCVPF